MLIENCLLAFHLGCFFTILSTTCQSFHWFLKQQIKTEGMINTIETSAVFNDVNEPILVQF